MSRIAEDRRNTWFLHDHGYAMGVVMGIIALLTVVTVGGFAVAQQTLHESVVNQRESQAFQAANGAIDAAVARLRLSGYRAQDFPMVFTRAQLGSGDATVTVTQSNPSEYVFTSVGRGEDGRKETIRLRLYMMSLYGMNMSYGSGFNQSSGGGKFNGNASVYGPFYTFDDLRQGENLGDSMAGGFGWGPIYIQGGTLDVKSGYLVDVGFLFVDPLQPDPKVVASGTQVIRSVPKMNVPRVDSAYLNNAYDQALAQSTDNIQGDPLVRTVTNSEPDPYPATLAPGASVGRYKIVDNDSTMNKSRTDPFVLGSTTASFGRPTDDFAWNHSTRTLTVWGTVFIDGPLRVANGLIRYVGNGTIVANGDVTFVNSNFIPLDPMLEGTGGDGKTYPNQRFNPDQVIGIATPGTIALSASTDNNDRNPDGPPTHAGAFFADKQITINTRVMLVGSVISQGIDVTGNNNMDLRTSPNLGEVVSQAMPGYGQQVISIGVWARQ